MSIRRTLIIFLALIAVSACGEKITSICGGTGSCCAIGYIDEHGGTNYSVYQCVASDQCGPECRNKYDGQTACPYQGPPTGSCGVEKKTVWIWESDSWKVMVPAAVEPIQRLMASAAGSGPPRTIAQCKLSCEKGLTTFCRPGMVPNSVSLGLLTTMTDIANSGDLSDRTIPISSIENNFKVSNALGPCPRMDILVRNGQILNSGAACDAEIGPLDAGTKVDANLTTDADVIADIVPDVGALKFSQESKGFGLKMVDDNLNQMFGGGLSSAANAGAAIAIQVKRPTNEAEPCLGIVPVAAAASNFFEVSFALSHKPEIISIAVTDAVAIVKKLADKAPPDDDSTAGSELFPLSSEYARIVASADSPERTDLVSKGYDIDLDGTKFTVSMAQALMFADLEICHNEIKDKDFRDLPDMLTSIDLSSAALDAGLASTISDADLVVRERLAGELVLCKYGYEALPENLKSGMRVAAEKAQIK